jgi:hypothetical protein
MAPVDCLRIALLPIAVVLAWMAAGADARAASRQSATAVFTASRPAQSTGIGLAIDYVNPDDPDAKPPAVQKVVTRLQPGTSIDGSVPARCPASDPELMARGAAACPAGSKVGGGEIDLDTGAPGPGRLVQNAVTLLNAGGELIFLLESKSDPRSRTVSRATVEGTTITSEVPPVPGGPPDGFLAIKRVRLSLEGRSVGQEASRRSYITTPSSCPASGSWTNSASFTYRDGVSQSVASRSPCQGRADRRDYKPPRIRLAGVPRRHCARRNFRARVRIAERWSGLRRAQLFVDERRLLSTRSKSLSRRIRVGRLSAGQHRLVVVALDNAGNRSAKTVSFHRCRRP